MTDSRKQLSSFRDPSGFVFTRDTILLRQINKQYQPHFDRLIHSGLYEKLLGQKLLIAHTETSDPAFTPEIAYKIIRPEIVSFISYPYEWCFSQLKHAALATLRTQKIALEHGMSLKDCSAYNIQFHKGLPVLIDTCSFEMYREGLPWVAYRQFCQHFLAPLALMSYRDVRLNQLLKVYIDGIPLDLASTLLPTRTRVNLSLLPHIHLHAKSHQAFSGKKVNTAAFRLTKHSLRGIVDDLQATITKLAWNPRGTEWADYYSDTNYSEAGQRQKQETVSRMLRVLAPRTVWDLGANIGLFSRIAAAAGMFTVAFDNDPAAHERNYLACVSECQQSLLPLGLDLTNPSPAIGWQNQERHSLLARGPADTVMALALVHHLAIGNNVPFSAITDFLRCIAKSLIIEFIPKSDSQIQRMLVVREDIFSWYTQELFERSLGEYFSIEESVLVKDSQRRIYRMRRRDS